jgi:hypothetical protein
MLIGQFQIAPGIVQILTHGDNRGHTGIGRSLKNFPTIGVKTRITNMGVGVDKYLMTQHKKAHGSGRKAHAKAPKRQVEGGRWKVDG